MLSFFFLNNICYFECRFLLLRSIMQLYKTQLAVSGLMTKPFKTASFFTSFVARNRLFLVILLLLLLPAYGYAKVTLYDGRDGLSSNVINCITKDKRGMMWIGTQNGLNIYDGYTFSKIEGVLSLLNINTLEASPSGQELWVGTTQGLYLVNLTTFATTRCTLRGVKDPRWTQGNVTGLHFSIPQRQLFATYSGGYVVSVTGSQARLLCRLQDTINALHDVLDGPEGNLLVNNGKVFSIDPGSGSSRYMQELRKAEPINAVSRSGDTLSLSSYNSGISMVHSRSLQPVSPASFQRHNNGFPSYIQNGTLIGRKLYLAGSNYSFFIYDLQSNTYIDVSAKYPELFEGKVYRNLFLDERNIVWVATNKGLLKVEERPVLFEKILYNLQERVSTRKMIEDRAGDVYIASYAGLYCFSKAEQQWHLYNRKTLPANTPEELNIPYPNSLLEDSSGNYLYVGSEHSRLILFNKRKKEYESLGITETGKEKIRNIAYMERDRLGRIWLACDNGLASYDPVTNTVKLHKGDAFDVGDVVTRVIYADPVRDLIYVGTGSGLFIVDIHKGILLHLTTESLPALTNDNIMFMDTDADGNLWLGTNGGGINILSADRKKIRYILKQNGLSSEIVYSILREDRNTVWIGTFNGLARYRIREGLFTFFFEEDGLCSNEFNHTSYLKSRDGKMYFGSINGVTTFYPDRIGQQQPFSIFVSGMSRWNEKSQSVYLSRKEISLDGVILKKPSDLLLEFHFGSTDYSDPLRSTFTYRIEHLSDNWISLEDKHTLNLGGLPYGEYTIEVRGTNAQGTPSANTLKFMVKVVQPFYKTWWFYLLLLVCTGAVLYAIYLLQYQSLKNLHQLRLRISSNLHDDVGSLLTRITMVSENLRYGKNTESQRNAKLDKIALLSRAAVASMSDVLWTIDSRNDFAGNLLDRMREHTEEMLSPLGIDVNFVTSGTDLKRSVAANIRRDIYLLFKEAINNIARHSKADHVDIIYRINEQGFYLKISNNGVPATHENSTGQGLSNIRMRAKKIGASVSITRQDDLFIIEVQK